MGCARKNKSWNFLLDLSLTASVLNTTRHIPVTNNLCTVNNHQFSHVGHNENLFLCYTDVADSSSRWQYETILYLELSSSPGQAGEGRELHKKRARELRN